MSKKKPRTYDPSHLIEAIKKWPNPMHDKKHGYYLYLEERARSNQTRIEHIVKSSHDLKVRDLELVPEGINNYLDYKKDTVYKNTYNYYIKRGGKDKGLIKVSVRISDRDSTYSWIKTIYITYRIK
ncbi:MAG: hypothetical protein K5906_04960 [Bacilli bacterium]|nr:hypothetical protein [Bacilli bacterium]